MAPVNLDADIRNADWTKTSDDLPEFKRREDLDAVIGNVSHWLRDLPSANPQAVGRVWHLLTSEERVAYEQRTIDDKRRIPGQRHNASTGLLVATGSAVLSSLANRGDNQDSAAIAQSVQQAFADARSRFAVDASLDAIEHAVTGLADVFLESLKDEYLPAAVALVQKSEEAALADLELARGRALSSDRSLARRRTPESAVSARRYALGRALRLVEDLSTTARTAARAILERDGLTHATKVRRLKNVIGLSDRQSDSFLRSMADLESARGRTITLGSFATVQVPSEGLTSEELAVAGDRYASYLTSQRADLIARTEGVTIREETRRGTWEREEPDAEFSWVTRGASCVTCEALSGKKVGPGQEYAPGVYVPPAHPGCDCTQAVHV